MMNAIGLLILASGAVLASGGCAISTSSSSAESHSPTGEHRHGPAPAMVSTSTEVLDVRAFGAAGDGVRLDTQSVQAAIDACHGQGGGTVLVRAGKYLIGTIVLRSQVTLNLASAAVLLGSTNTADYATNVARCGFVNEHAIDKCLVYAGNAEAVAITGRGTIDGQGAAFPGTLANGQPGERPMLLRFFQCRDVSLDGVTFRSAGSWCCHFRESADVQVRGITIHNRANHNNDGIDLMSTERVRISDCTLLCEDDAICFQDMSDERPVQDIVINNCLMSTRWAAIRSGGAHRGGIRRVTVSNCVISDTYGCGIKLQVSGNGSLEDMTFDNIVMTRVSSPLSLRFGNHHYNNELRDASFPFGRMRNLVFSNIRATVIGEAALRKAVPNLYPGEERQCISICGIPGHPVENVTLNNIEVTFPGGGTKAEAAKSTLPELEDQYPEYFMWGVLPAYGLYARHARGLTLNNVRFDLAEADFRPAVVCDDVEDLELADLKAQANPNAESLLRLRASRGAFIHSCRPLGQADAFLRVEGPECANISLAGNRLNSARKAVVRADGASPVDLSLQPNASE